MAQREMPYRPPMTSGFTLAQRLSASQAFWITLALVLISLAMAVVSDNFATYNNAFNITRNFSFIAIMALGMTAVIITGGIDLSVGSVMGLSGIVLGMLMAAGHGLWFSGAVALLVALACGAVNGYLIAYLKLSPFVVTLGMLSIARSLALVVSDNRMFYQFGPDERLLFELGGGRIWGIPSSLVILVVLMLLVGFLFRYTRWGRHLYAIGGNEDAARLTGVSVNLVKLSAYLLSAFMAGFAAILMVGWLGSVTNGLGLQYELRVIAASVIGGASLMGGQGTAFGALVGAALVEVIRNSLLLAGVDPYWQGAFIGAFIIFAVLLQRIREARSD